MRIRVWPQVKPRDALCAYYEDRKIHVTFWYEMSSCNEGKGFLLSMVLNIFIGDPFCVSFG